MGDDEAAMWYEQWTEALADLADALTRTDAAEANRDEWEKAAIYEKDQKLKAYSERNALTLKLERYREALGELTDAAKEYREIVAGWFDFSDTDAHDELNAALVHADRELAARQALQADG